MDNDSLLRLNSFFTTLRNIQEAVISLEQNDSGRLLTRARKQLWLSGLGGTAGEPSSSSERNTLAEGVFPSYTVEMPCNYYPA